MYLNIGVGIVALILLGAFVYYLLKRKSGETDAIEEDNYFKEKNLFK